jgi:hypothetical protein
VDGKAKPCHDAKIKGGTIRKLLKCRIKRRMKESGEFLDFGGSGWLDRPRSGGAALAPRSV